MIERGVINARAGPGWRERQIELLRLGIKHAPDRCEQDPELLLRHGLNVALPVNIESIHGIGSQVGDQTSGKHLSLKLRISASSKN